MKENERVIALLIDAENVSPKYIKVILDELSLYGTPAYKRIYGDWTNTDMGSWKKQLLENNLTPVQQFSYTQGKNASDSAMIIDAMDILYSKNCDGFCLVSSDSDFTRLAARLRESRMYVIGMGESKTPVSFKSACDAFKYLDILMKANQNKGGAPLADGGGRQRNGKKQPAKPAAKQPAKPAPEAAPQVAEPLPELVVTEAHDEVSTGFVPLEEIVEKIKDIIDNESDEEGYMPLAQVGSILGRLYPDFDTRNYGFSKLHKLIAYTGEFDTRSENPQGGGNLMVRNSVSA